MPKTFHNEKPKWCGTHSGVKAGKTFQPVSKPDTKALARLKARQTGHAEGLKNAANKNHGHQVPGSMKKVC